MEKKVAIRRNIDLILGGCPSNQKQVGPKLISVNYITKAPKREMI